jgi:hypothetical protein
LVFLRRFTGEPAIYGVSEDAKHDYTPVIFATLTDENGTELGSFLGDVQKTIRRLSNRSKCHLKAEIGYEEPNTHSHIIFSVPSFELDKFRTRMIASGRFANEGHQMWGWWRRSEWPLYEAGKGNSRSYVLDKHTPLLPEVYCPRQSRSCRAGHCRHHDAPAT